MCHRLRLGTFRAETVLKINQIQISLAFAICLFMRAYHLTSESWGLKAIKLRRLKIALFNDMNDPFELLGAELKTRQDRAELKHLKKETNAMIGALCFSRDCGNPVLWSHYADKHRGICLGFDIRDDWAHEITYQGERLQEIEKDLLEGEKEILGHRLLTTKFDHWRYEDEVRLILKLEDAVQESGNYFLPFGDTLNLKEIIIGARCNMPFDELGKMVDKDVEISRGRLAPDLYKISKGGIPDG
jgi:hypothetical protein